MKLLRQAGTSLRQIESPRLAIAVILIMASSLLSRAQESSVRDAFSGIWPVTDPTQTISLNGHWSLKVTEGTDKSDNVPPKDDSWKTVPVPGCWDVNGFCKPSYGKAEEMTGYYRTTFSVPEEWRGRRTVIRFDGVLYGYDLWINGRHAGRWRSGYNTALFDITPYLVKGGRQELAMRVITNFPGSDFDYNDDWAPSGIIRDVTLFSVPQPHISDFHLETESVSKAEATMRFDFEAANAGKAVTVKADIISPSGVAVSSFETALTGGRATQRVTIGDPLLWTAETPDLYIIRYSLWNKKQLLQSFENKFGVRKLTIEGNIIKLNGRPVKFRGVTCHSTSPVTGKVINDSLTLLDMRLMKEASVNYIRTSHYPREPRFYELADSLGFYVIDEVPFGYGDKNLSRRAFYPVLQQRAQATIRRDRNHASVLIWSLGNENPLTEICKQLGQYVKDSLDTSRPVCYPQVGSYFRRFNYDFPAVADIYAPHYPTTSQIGGFYQRADRPVIFTEYCHTLGISFEDHDRQWEIIERTPCIAGGSVWEWVDQGMPFKAPLTSRYGYEERVFTSPEGGFEMCGNKGTDGLLYADRTPLPNYYELQHNYAQAAVTDSVVEIATGKDADVALTVRNRYDFINLKDNTTFRWTLTADRDTIARGAFSPDCAPRSTASHTLRLPMRTVADDPMALLAFEIADRHGRIINRHTVRLRPRSLTPRLLAGLTTATDDPTKLFQNGLLVRAGRKATMAERLKANGSRLEKYLLPLTADKPVSKSGRYGKKPDSAGDKSARNNDKTSDICKMIARSDSMTVKADIRTTKDANATRIDFTLTPDTTDTFLSEFGIAMLLDSSIDRVCWIGNGPMPTYPGRYRAGRYGIWAMLQGDLYFEGNRRGVDAALLTDKDGNGLLLFCDNGNISFEQTDRGIVISVNAAVSGQGPKFSRTAFPVTAKNVGSVSGSFYIYRTDASRLPDIIRRLFIPASAIPASFHPFETQYDTYLMKAEDVMK